jgi:hypothetical protein
MAEEQRVFEGGQWEVVSCWEGMMLIFEQQRCSPRIAWLR